MVETQSQVCKTCKQVCAVSPLSGGSCASGKADGVAGLLSESALTRCVHFSTVGSFHLYLFILSAHPSVFCSQSLYVTAHAKMSHLSANFIASYEP